MSNEDYENGKNGHFWATYDHEHNDDYQRGQTDSIVETASAFTDALLGHGGNSGEPSVGGKMVFYFGLSIVLFFIMLFVGFVGLNIFVHSLSSSKPETAQEKLLQNRRPFEFDGYTLYSGPRHSRFLRFSLKNPDGNVIWKQPESMDHLWVSEERPIGYITSKKDFYPGRTVFTMILTGPQQQTYQEFLILNKKGQIVRFSQYGPRHKIPEKLPFQFS